MKRRRAPVLIPLIKRLPVVYDYPEVIEIEEEIPEEPKIGLCEVTVIKKAKKGSRKRRKEPEADIEIDPPKDSITYGIDYLVCSVTRVRPAGACEPKEESLDTPKADDKPELPADSENIPVESDPLGDEPMSIEQFVSEQEGQVEEPVVTQELVDEKVQQKELQPEDEPHQEQPKPSVSNGLCSITKINADMSVEEVDNSLLRELARTERKQKLEATECSICGKVLIGSMEFLYHIFDQHQKEKFRCDICSVMCVSRSHLTMHKEWIHQVYDESEDDYDSDEYDAQKLEVGLPPPRPASTIEPKAIFKMKLEPGIKMEPMALAENNSGGEEDFDDLPLTNGDHQYSIEEISPFKGNAKKKQSPELKKVLATQCKECLEFFKTMKERVEHEESVHKASGLCELCGTTFPNILLHKVRKHVLEVDAPGNCMICFEEIDDSLRRHGQENHAEIFMTRCLDCSQLFPSKKAVTRHRAEVHVKDAELCNICGKIIGGRQMKRHLEVGHAFHCFECGADFDNKYAKVYHRYSAHDISDDTLQEVLSAISCQICDFVANKPTDLDKHKMMKHKQVVGKRSQGRPTLMLESEAAALRKYICPVCNQGLKNSQTLKTHAMGRHKVKLVRLPGKTGPTAYAIEQQTEAVEVYYTDSSILELF